MRITNEHGYTEISIDEMDDSQLILDMVEVREKRKGYGSELVKQAIDYARAEGKNLTLCATLQDDSISLDDLIAFYENQIM